jgi:hypothetical protein
MGAQRKLWASFVCSEHMTKTTLIDLTVTISEDSDASVVVKKEQPIPQSFLDRLKTFRDDSSNRRMGDFERIASIPTVVVEKWMREGFNIWDKNVKASEIVARLNKENLQAFLTTTKRI